MVHTFEISFRTTKEKAIKILNNYCDIKTTQELLEGSKREIAITNPIDKPGIAVLTIGRNTKAYYTVSLKIEPQSLLKDRLTIETYDCSTASKIILQDKLDKAIEEICDGGFPDSEFWKVTRIDYTKNLRTGYADKCVLLAKKGKDPYCFEDNVKKPGSSYRASKSSRLNYYNKLDHILKQTELIAINPHLIEEARNIFRVEVQCRGKSKMEQIRKKHLLPKVASIYDYLDAEIAETVLTYYYEKVIGYGDYYSKYEADKIIDATNWTKRKKENIKDWLQLVAQARSVSKAMEQYVVGTKIKNTNKVINGSSASIKNYMSALAEINVNPVTIPKDWNIDNIPNPYKAEATDSKAFSE